LAYWLRAASGWVNRGIVVVHAVWSPEARGWRAEVWEEAMKLGAVYL